MTQKGSTPRSQPPVSLLARASLFLDFDGTLVQLASRPDFVKVEAKLSDLLAILSTKLQGRLAIVTGRPAEQVRTLFGQPKFAIAGSHGVELHWPDGRVVTPSFHDDRAVILQRARELAETYAGLIVEDKPFGVALHYRLAPQAERACISLATRLAEDTGYLLQTGKMVVELKFSSGDKGDAVKAFMSEPPMMDGRPIFIGDDDTDEAGFLMASHLGGVGVLVGATKETAAAYRLADVDETLRWLKAAGEATS